jgi:hypothetical protein
MPPNPPAAPDVGPAEPTPSDDAERGPTATDDGSPEGPPPSNEGPTLRILERLARGEISVDEAQRLLGQRR